MDDAAGGNRSGQVVAGAADEDFEPDDDGVDGLEDEELEEPEADDDESEDEEDDVVASDPDLSPADDFAAALFLAPSRESVR